VIGDRWCHIGNKSLNMSGKNTVFLQLERLKLKRILMKNVGLTLITVSWNIRL